MDSKVRILLAAITLLSFHFVLDNVPVNAAKENRRPKLMVFTFADDEDRHGPSLPHDWTSCMAVFKDIDGKWKRGKEAECVVWPPLKYYETFGRIRRRRGKKDNEKKEPIVGNSSLGTFWEIVGTGIENGKTGNEASRIGLWTMGWIIVYTVFLAVLQKILAYWKSKMADKRSRNLESGKVAVRCSNNMASQTDVKTEMIAISGKDRDTLIRPIDAVEELGSGISFVTKISCRESDEMCKDILTLQEKKAVQSQGQIILSDQSGNGISKNSSLECSLDADTLPITSEPDQVIYITKKTCYEREPENEVNMNDRNDSIEGKEVEITSFSQADMYMLNVSHFERFYGKSKIIDSEGRSVREHQNGLRDKQWRVLKRVMDNIAMERQNGFNHDVEMEEEIITAEGDRSAVAFKLLKPRKFVHGKQEESESLWNVVDEASLDEPTFSCKLDVSADKQVPQFSSRSNSLDHQVIDKSDVGSVTINTEATVEKAEVKPDFNMAISNSASNTDSTAELDGSYSKVVDDHPIDLNQIVGKNDTNSEEVTNLHSCKLHQVQILHSVCTQGHDRQINLGEAETINEELQSYLDRKTHSVSDDEPCPTYHDVSNDEHKNKMIYDHDQDKIFVNVIHETSELDSNQALECACLLTSRDTERCNMKTSHSVFEKPFEFADGYIETDHDAQEKEAVEEGIASSCEEKDGVVDCDKDHGRYSGNNLDSTVKNQCLDFSDEEMLEKSRREGSLLSAIDGQEEVLRYSITDEAVDCTSCDKHVSHGDIEVKPDEETSLSSPDMESNTKDRSESNLKLKSDQEEYGDGGNSITSEILEEGENSMPVTNLQQLIEETSKMSTNVEDNEEFDESYYTNLLQMMCKEMLPNHDPQLLTDAYDKFEQWMEAATGDAAVPQNREGNAMQSHCNGSNSNIRVGQHKPKDAALKNNDLLSLGTRQPSLLMDMPCYGIIPQRRIDPSKAMKFWLSGLHND